MRRTIFLLTAFGLATGPVAARADVLLSGPTANAGSYSTAQLAALATPSDTVSAGGLTGISLWGLLGGAASATATSPIYGAITTTTPAGDNGKNAILRYYLVGQAAARPRSFRWARSIRRSVAPARRRHSWRSRPPAAPARTTRTDRARANYPRHQHAEQPAVEFRRGAIRRRRR